MHSMPKMFAVNVTTGTLNLLTPSQPLLRAVNNNNNNNGGKDGGDDFLLWLEEYANRLTRKEIDEGIMGSHPLDPKGITLYPRWIPTPSSPSPPPAVPLSSNTIPRCSHAVTRGVQVIASALYVPQANDQFGFIYSIRIRLLRPNDSNAVDGYLTPEERGFDTCQLRSRHWQICNTETGETNDVHGQGVIGMYPILEDGGYTDGGERLDGIFQYQSCTGPMRKGYFQGSLEFVPGRIDSPTGPPFQVELKPFLLDNEPTFIY